MQYYPSLSQTIPLLVSAHNHDRARTLCAHKSGLDDYQPTCSRNTVFFQLLFRLKKSFPGKLPSDIHSPFYLVTSVSARALCLAKHHHRRHRRYSTLHVSNTSPSGTLCVRCAWQLSAPTIPPHRFARTVKNNMCLILLRLFQTWRRLKQIHGCAAQVH